MHATTFIWPPQWAQVNRESDQLGLHLTGSGPTEQLTVCDVQVVHASVFCCRVSNLALIQLRRAVA
jgi:hypothetical protein